jgi:hypothetical protein
MTILLIFNILPSLAGSTRLRGRSRFGAAKARESTRSDATTCTRLDFSG